MKRVIINLLSMVSAGLFANGTAEDVTRTIKSTQTRVEFKTIGEVQVEPSEDILEIFSDHDDYTVDAEYLKAGINLRLLSDDVMEDIDSVLEEDTDDIKDLIIDELQANLKAGEIEYAYMILGRNLFSASYDF